MRVEPFVMYEIEIEKLSLVLKDGREFIFPEALANGRANYIIFENLVRNLALLYKTTGSDHQDDLKRQYEQKAYLDPVSDPEGKEDIFRCSSSNTFGANRYGKQIKAMLDDGDYDSAYELVCLEGYTKNDFYVFTNTSGYVVDHPFRFFIVPTVEVLRHLDAKDPRMISRSALLSLLTDTRTL